MRQRQPGSPAARRMMVYCHDSMGIGHLRRSVTICDCLTARFPRSSFLLATGTPYVPLFELPRGVDYVKLPALTKRTDGDYASKYLALHTRQLFKCRKALLLATVNYLRPTILLVDKTPVGVFREMVPVLDWLQRNCPETRIVFGMRDIEDTPEATIRQWDRNGVPQALEEYFDEIWVYGDRNVFDVATAYQLSDSLRQKLHYTGYLERTPCAHAANGSHHRPRVLVTTGGGSDGLDLIGTFVSDAAGRVADLGGSSTIVAGPDATRDEAARLREVALGVPRTRWLDHTGCMSCLMREADLVVSMGGYNTLCEVASYRKPTLVVPRIKPRYEQALRAELWSELGVVAMARPESLSPQKLGDHVLALLERPQPPDRSGLNMGGLAYIADRCALLWNKGRSVETPVRV